MEWATTTLAFYGLGAAALATSMVTLGRRLELSQAKHRSLAGHARMARRVASLIPFYDFGEQQFFRSDDAPDDVATKRRDGFLRLAGLYRERFPQNSDIRCNGRNFAVSGAGSTADRPWFAQSIEMIHAQVFAAHRQRTDCQTRRGDCRQRPQIGAHQES